MITEDYVSFKTAKLLKEKGFDSKIQTCYTPDGMFAIATGMNRHSNRSEDPACECICPTLQMAMKWLREVHHLSIEPYYSFVLNWVVDIKHIGKHTDIKEFEHVRDNNYDSYEKACEAAIKYCLQNLI